MNRHTTLVLVLVASLVVPGIAVAAVYGSPDLSTSLADNRVTPGEDTTLQVVVANSGNLESGSAANPSLNAEVTEARALSVDLEAGNGPLSVQTPDQTVGSLPRGGTATLSYNVAIDEGADPGTYRLPVVAEYDYTSYISEGDGSRDQSSTTENLGVQLRVVDQAHFEIVDIVDDAQVGADGQLNVTVQNAGTEAASDAVVSVQAANADTTFGQTQTASRHVGQWEPGENRTLSFTLTTASSADTEPYNFGLSVAYEDADGVAREDAGNSFGVTPAPEQSFSLENAEGTLAVGEDGTLEAELVNEGDQPVDDVVLQWTSELQTVSVTEREYAVGRLGPGERATVSFDVEVSEDARSGPRQFNFVANYSDSDGDRRTSDTLDVRQEVGPSADTFDLSVDNATLTAGGGGQLEVTITNADDEAVSDVSAKLFADSPISTTDDEAFVSSLDPGESETLVFGVGAAGGAIEKTYPVSLDFRYEDADGDTELSDTYRLPVDVVEPEEGGGLPIVPILVVLIVVVLAVVGYTRYR